MNSNILIYHLGRKFALNINRYVAIGSPCLHPLSVLTKVRWNVLVLHIHICLIILFTEYILY